MKAAKALHLDVHKNKIELLLKDEYLDGDNTHLQSIFNKIINNYRQDAVLNMSGVLYINSSGISRIIELVRALSDVGRKLTIEDMSPQVEMILKVTNVFKAIEIFNRRSMR